MPTLETFRLPDVGEGLTEADLVSWNVAVGDTVTVNQTICEIETAKSVVDLPSPWAGVVRELLATEGQTVEVGAPIIVIDVGPEGAPAGGQAAGQRGQDASEGQSASAGQDASAGEDASLGDAGQEPSTGGAVLVGYGSTGASGRRRRRRTAGHDGEPPSSGDVAADETPPSDASPARPATPAAGEPDDARILTKPPVRKLAKDLGVDLSAVSATGPGGIITREDVLAHASGAQAQQLATYPGDDQPWLAGGTVSEHGRRTRVPVRSVRRRTAEAMVTSAFTAPHVTVFRTVDVTRTMKLVARLREDREFADVRVTPLLIAMRALVLAVRRHPEVNASWDDEAQEIIYKHYVNLGIAASTPRGLVVPNIKDAHRMNLRELAGALAELTATARAGRATPHDMLDGTVTITNVGIFGIDTGTPILNPGESAILAFGAIREQPWMHKGKVRPRAVSQLALSFDHRLIDGELGARVLSDVARVLEEPAQGLVWS
ncbi:dihydrolipoamide acetyltransferase family protein [Georgenia sp. 10Sc9-8]|uniref:Dihydrolipoamide acetyltransferase component of pyruvate dehydrogenase complex n=1 Tax=Georgenia halotolerans TaxID=3028317 RepID=A0ABT5TYQ9_9MICO|nr:dihydrolipoamide acetyltransferase family protein [Georgenia halotolerans]